MGNKQLLLKHPIWVSDNHNLAILGYPHKKAHKKRFRFFLACDFFVIVDILLNSKKQKSFCCNLFLCSLLFGFNALDYDPGFRDTDDNIYAIKLKLLEW